MSFVDDIIAKYNDLDRRLSRIEKLDRPSANTLPAYSGTPVANALAYWPGAGTVAGDRPVYVSSAGSVSIGTAAPASGAVLDVLGSLNGVLKQRLTNSNANSGAYASYQLINDVGNIGAFFMLSSTNGNYAGTNSFNMVNAGSAPLGLGANDTIRLVIEANGNIRIGPTTPRGKLDIDQSSTTAAIPPLVLDQADLSEEFIRFVATVGAGNPIDTAAVGTHYGKIRVYVEGVGVKYIELFNT